jgi:ribose transport system permease protein
MTTRQVDAREQSPVRRGLADLGDVRRGVYGVWTALVLLLVFAAVVRPSLIQPNSLQTIAVLAAVTAVVGLGQSAVIYVSGIDLSLPWVMTLSGVLFAKLANGAEDRLLYALVVSVLVGAAIGLLNGIGSVVLGIHPVVTTLAVGAILEGATLGFTGGLVTGSPPRSVGHFMLGVGNSIPPVLFALLVLTIAVTFVMRQTGYGRRLQAASLNPVAARLAGVSSSAVTASAYVISGVCAALGGVMVAGLSGQSYLGMGSPYLLISVAVVALGGASFAGGRGNFLGTLGGALVLSVLTTLLTTFHLSEGLRVIVQGAVILLAVVAANLGMKRD